MILLETDPKIKIQIFIEREECYTFTASPSLLVTSWGTRRSFEALHQPKAEQKPLGISRDSQILGKSPGWAPRIPERSKVAGWAQLSSQPRPKP